jgi:hypothetical protein
MIGRYTNHGLHSVLFRSGSSQWKNYHSFSSRATVSTASVARLSSNAVVSEAEDRFPDPTAQYPGAGTSTTPSAQSQSWERSSPQPPTTVKLHDLLHHGCLPYPQTWAFQQVLLHRRLHQRRRQTQQVQQNQQQPPTARQSSSSPIEDDCDDDFDCVVLLEHSPVYTLGRGADEKHLTFVQQQQKKQQQKIEADEKLYSSEQERAAAHSTLDEVSQKLSRKVRGPGTARLSVDKNMEDQLQDLTRRKAGNSDDGEQSMLTVVERLTESVSPVIAPNGVPVYRVDRGGEGTAVALHCVACMSEFVCIPVYSRVCIVFFPRAPMSLTSRTDRSIRMRSSTNVSFHFISIAPHLHIIVHQSHITALRNSLCIRCSI